MQLPFVLQSAETMKAAVSFLEPHMEKVEGSSRGTMVLATVKGDVHDIGKNLVDIILTNNGYKVVNLGIKQPIENIISAAEQQRATCIGMSGLLVKSTVIMKENLDILNQRGIALPVILGGAALTRRYVEDDCRKVYRGMLFYGQDAFDDLRIMEALAKGDDMKRFLGHCAEVECYDDDEPSADDASSTEAAVAAAARRAMMRWRRQRVSSWSGAGENLDNGSNGANGDRRSKLAAAKAPIKVRDGKITSVTRSDVAREHEIPVPPFWGSRVVDDVPLSEVFAHINQTALIKGQWRVRRGDMSLKDYDTLLNERVLPASETTPARVY